MEEAKQKPVVPTWEIMSEIQKVQHLKDELEVIKNVLGQVAEQAQNAAVVARHHLHAPDGTPMLAAGLLVDFARANSKRNKPV